MSRVFTNGLGDQGSIPGRVIPKTQKMVLDATLLDTQHYKVRIKVKWSNLYLNVAAIEKGTSGHPRLKSPTYLQLTYIYIKVIFKREYFK